MNTLAEIEMMKGKEEQWGNCSFSRRNRRQGSLNIYLGILILVCLEVDDCLRVTVKFRSERCDLKRLFFPHLVVFLGDWNKLKRSYIAGAEAKVGRASLEHFHA